MDANRAYRLAEMGCHSYSMIVGAFVRGYVTAANDTWKAAGKKGVRFDLDGREPTPAEAEQVAIAETRNYPRSGRELVRM